MCRKIIYIKTSVIYTDFALNNTVILNLTTSAVHKTEVDGLKGDVGVFILTV